MQLRTYTITAAVAILNLLTTPTTALRNPQPWWQRALSSGAGIKDPGLAPLLFCCSSPPEDLVPKTYIIRLHPGCSFEVHRRVVGDSVDLDKAITKLRLGTGINKVFYRAVLEDAELDAVRADWAVDFVECCREVRWLPLERFGRDAGNVPESWAEYRTIHHSS